MEMNQGYRAIRAKSGKRMDSCVWCSHEFIDGEMMSIAQPENGKNVLLCHTCADALLQSDSLKGG